MADKSKLVKPAYTVKPLETFTGEQLLRDPPRPERWVVRDMLAPGLAVLAGDPKVGKSWLSLQLALAVSSGEAFLGNEVQQGGVLYFAMEDNRERLARRLRLLTEEGAPSSLRFTTSARGITSGLFKQVYNELLAHPDIGLVIIDTFQTVRCREDGQDYSYASDYNDIRELKKFASDYDLAVLLVHHTRKMGDSTNIFNRISGTQGIGGASDTNMVLAKEHVFDKQATLYTIGRDGASRQYRLLFGKAAWQLVEMLDDDKLIEQATPAAVKDVAAFAAGLTSTWSGTASQLIEAAGVTDVQPNVLARLLNEYCSYLNDHGVDYGYKRTPAARLVTLTPAGAVR